jgi:cytochrome c biogenesis protein CcdA
MALVLEYIACYLAAYSLGFASALLLVAYVKHKNAHKVTLKYRRPK